jgi:hypothetical protein
MLRSKWKKWAAAAVALFASAFYLLLSGAEVATQRSFLMTAVLLIAVLVDRRAKRAARSRGRAMIRTSITSGDDPMGCVAVFPLSTTNAERVCAEIMLKQGA